MRQVGFFLWLICFNYFQQRASVFLLRLFSNNEYVFIGLNYVNEELNFRGMGQGEGPFCTGAMKMEHQRQQIPDVQTRLHIQLEIILATILFSVLWMIEKYKVAEENFGP